MKLKPDKFDFALIISLIVGISNGIVVNLKKPLLMNTIVIFPLIGGVVHSIVSGNILHCFDDVVESLVYFGFLCFVFILGISIIPMLITGIVLNFIMTP